MPLTGKLEAKTKEFFLIIIFRRRRLSSQKINLTHDADGLFPVQSTFLTAGTLSSYY